MLNFMRSIPLNLLFTVAPLAILISACTAVDNPSLTKPSSLNKIAYPSSIDPDLNEHIYPNEAVIAEEISDVIEKSIRKQYSVGTALRDAHPKAHGCVRAEFQVSETLPRNLAQGVFIPGKTYPAWIRFSNGSRDATQADIKADARGMAIKLALLQIEI